MSFRGMPSRTIRRGPALLGGALAGFLLAAVASSHGQKAPAKPLLIGWSAGLVQGEMSNKEKAGLESLQALIKEETGLENDILPAKDWRVLVGRLKKGDLQLGVFPGYEFAWAQEQSPKLKPLALAVNAHRYPVACVMVRKDSKARDFAAIQGQALALCLAEPSHVHLFVERQTQAAGKKPAAFFARITRPDNVEDALDDVVDNVVQVTVLDRAGLEAYQRRKPGRFNRLKELTHSRPFPPTVVGYLDGAVDPKLLRRFRDGLLGANRKEKGQSLLTLFRLTGFEGVPKDFDRVLTETHKDYPPDPIAK